jgi:hypothetical protein
MNPKITPQPATKTPGKFQKQLVQLDACNLDNPEAKEQPHSSLFFRGGDILNEIDEALAQIKPRPELVRFGHAFAVRISTADSAAILESIGFKREIPGSNLFHRPTP